VAFVGWGSKKRRKKRRGKEGNKVGSIRESG
jgi:hypothetical protein